MQPMGQVSTIKGFLQSCVKLLYDPSSVEVLQNMLERCSVETKGKLEQEIVNHLHTRRITSREFRLNTNIGDFNMGDIIMDLGSEVNAQEDMAMYGRAHIRIFTHSAETGKSTQSSTNWETKRSGSRPRWSVH
jgi:hypothetical protein